VSTILLVRVIPQSQHSKCTTISVYTIFMSTLWMARAWTGTSPQGQYMMISQCERDCLCNHALLKFIMLLWLILILLYFVFRLCLQLGPSFISFQWLYTFFLFICIYCKYLFLLSALRIAPPPLSFQVSVLLCSRLCYL